MAKYLLSLPPHVVESFHLLTNKKQEEWFCTSDPQDKKLGSGGGTAWLLNQCFQAEQSSTTDFQQWLSKERRILLHAGGQSRRLPAYAPQGKILTPIPIFRWERGQAINQNLLDLQIPFYQSILAKAPKKLNTLIASGDVYIRTTQPLDEIPEVDVVCYGLWGSPEQAKNHGVFMINRQTPKLLDYMLQKPTIEKLSTLSATHFFLLDIGVWLFSDKAIQKLIQKSTTDTGDIQNYDLYGSFGCALGTNPSQKDIDLTDLTVAVIPLNGGEFYHYGTSPELISSTTKLQNVIKDQRIIIQKEVKQHTTLITQNASINRTALDHLENVWIENSHIPNTWTLKGNHILTGIPFNEWHLNLLKHQCLDIVPIADKQYVIRPYGFTDAFKGNLADHTTTFIGKPFKEWATERQLNLTDFKKLEDLQDAKLFPIVENLKEIETLIQYFFTITQLTEHEIKALSAQYLSLPRLSAEEITAKANLLRIEEQRNSFRKINVQQMAKNHQKSVFYQSDLKYMAEVFAQNNLPLPETMSEENSLMVRIHDAMFRSAYYQNKQEPYEDSYNRAFKLLSEGLVNSIQKEKQNPQLAVCKDQIVWGRSPVRIDLAGGWTDTPPYSLTTGGNVVNMAILLNGQPPLQTYIKPSKDFVITCRSIDLGATERIETYEDLSKFNQVGSPFSIPKAALALAGFLPTFSQVKYTSLKQQLKDFGCGIEITLLSAIPAGSGLGTSSILASTILGTLSNFCNLGWDNMQIGNRTLILEQLLTTGGGWQDQYGGLLPGVKLLQSKAGFEQTPIVRYLPERLFTNESYRSCHLLYYTGITRTAKNILAEIVKGMFLNEHHRLSLLNEMKAHALAMHDVIQKGDFHNFGKLVGTTWLQNQLLDSGTAPESIQYLCKQIQDLCLGYKLPGAGGGGYLYMVAKDPEAAMLIRQRLTQNPLNPNARFVELNLSLEGLQISRS